MASSDDGGLVIGSKLTVDEFLAGFQAGVAKGLESVKSKWRIALCRAMRGFKLGHDFTPHKDGDMVLVGGVAAHDGGGHKAFHFVASPSDMTERDLARTCADLVEALETNKKEG